MKLNDSRLNEWRREEMETAIKSMLWEIWSFSFLTVRELNEAKFWKLPEEKERSNTAEREKISEVESICIINFSISPLLSTRCILISQMLKKKKILLWPLPCLYSYHFVCSLTQQKFSKEVAIIIISTFSPYIGFLTPILPPYSSEIILLWHQGSLPHQSQWKTTLCSHLKHLAIAEPIWILSFLEFFDIIIPSASLADPSQSQHIYSSDRVLNDSVPPPSPKPSSIFHPHSSNTVA